jgi:tryptophan halogenase
MKLTIIGRGNAGCISALHFYHYSNYFNLNMEIELIYDSKIEPVPVGQATTLDLVNFLWVSTKSEELQNFQYTQKTGIMYENWGKKNKKWFHEFPFGSYAIHFNPKTFQDYVINNLKINFKETDENVINYDKIDSDFIIDCRGAPNDMKEYDPLINPLNCALLSSLPVDKNILWTRTVATPDGWCFYIPLQDRVSVGYLFNKGITTEKEAENNFKKLFNIEKINKVFNFNQYVAKKPIINERVFLNGNKLFFLEPLEATAMNVYQKWCRYIWDCVVAKKHNFNFAENEIKNYINQIQNFILWHYDSGSIYDTHFWEYAKKMYQENKSNDFEKIINETNKYSIDFLKNNNLVFPYAQWTGWNTKNWCEGMGI